MAQRVTCSACSASVELEGPVGRSARCARCGSDLRCCLNCRFHDLASYNDCAEPSAERILEKDRANYCDYFSPRGATDERAVTAQEPAQDPSAATASPLSDLEKLFRRS